uniref:NADH-ubiquinone oxidoreductase chain 4L n=1 Tax=Hydroptila sp. XG-2021 TaxID=2996735 RepID=A0A9E8LNW1_9NEOP|nr:NADH dehydrogenase subunit 4L [Hydroptila sp. XG-2021]
MSIYYTMLLVTFMFIIGNLIFSLCREHLLLVLMSLEFMVLVVFLGLMSYLMMVGEIYFLMVFLVFSVCEGVLGISLLVYMIRMYGNDYFSSFNLLC